MRAPRAKAKTQIPWADRYRFGTDEDQPLPLRPHAPADPTMERLVTWAYEHGFHPIQAIPGYLRLEVFNPHALAAEAQRLMRGLRISLGIEVRPPIAVSGRFEFFAERARDSATPCCSTAEIRLLGVDDSALPAKPSPFSEPA